MYGLVEVTKTQMTVAVTNKAIAIAAVRKTQFVFMLQIPLHLISRSAALQRQRSGITSRRLLPLFAPAHIKEGLRRSEQTVQR